jgi:hypothetical protein
MRASPLRSTEKTFCLLTLQMKSSQLKEQILRKVIANLGTSKQTALPNQILLTLIKP